MNENPFSPPEILLSVDADSEWVRIRRAFWRWQFGMVIWLVTLGILLGVEWLGLLIATILALIVEEWPCERFRRFALYAIKKRQPDIKLAGLRFIGVAAQPTSKRLSQGSDYVGFLRFGDEAVTILLHDRELSIANAAIRAVKQVKVPWDTMSLFGVRAVQITFVEQNGIRQIVLVGKATTVFGMKRAGQALYEQLKALEPEKLLTLGRY